MITSIFTRVIDMSIQGIDLTIENEFLQAQWIMAAKKASHEQLLQMHIMLIRQHIAYVNTTNALIKEKIL